MRFDGPARCLVPCNEPACRAIADLPNEHGAYLRIVGAADLIPHFPIGIAKASERAEALCVGERQHGSVEGLGLVQIRLTACGLGAVEPDLGMGAVAIRLGAGLTATAQSIFLPRRVAMALRPAFGIAVRIRGDDLFCQRHVPGDDVGAILRHTYAAFDLGLTHERLHRAADRGPISNANRPAIALRQGHRVYVR